MPARKFNPERAVYFNGLPKHVPREEVYNWARALGWVRKLDLPDGYGSYHNKGYAYIHFKKEKEAQAVIARKKLTWKGHNITVHPYEDTRPEEERIPYKDRVPPMNAQQTKASNEIMSMLQPSNTKKLSWANVADSGFTTSIQTPSDETPRRSRSTSDSVSVTATPKAVNKQPTIEEINEAVVSWSRQNSVKTVTQENQEDILVNEMDGLVIPTLEEEDELELSPPVSWSNLSDDAQSPTEQQTPIQNGFSGMIQENAQQPIAYMPQQPRMYLDSSIVSMMYKVLSDEMEKMNAQNGTNLTVSNCPHLVDSFFNEFMNVLATNNISTV